MGLLLDTSTFLWYISGSDQLPESVREQIRQYPQSVFLSSVSVWEILVKNQLGKLPLPEAPAEYIPFQRKKHGIESLALAEDSVLPLPKLPAIHRDPFDRMLICQTISHQLRLVTGNAAVRQYPIPTLWG